MADPAKANEQLIASEKRLKERLKFETLLAELSAHFVNLPADRIDSEIEDAQRRICEFLDLDRSTLWQVPEDEPGMLLLTHIHQPPEGRTPVERMNVRDFFPWTARKVLDGEVVSISKISDLPPEASRDIETFGLYDSKSTVCIPLSVGKGAVFGLLSFAVIREKRDWPETVLMGFKLIAQVFANALARKQAEETSREGERILRQNERDLRGLAGRLIHAQEEERSRLARELHDDLGNVWRFLPSMSDDSSYS